MIKVTVGINLNRETVEVDESTTTIRSVLDNNGIDYNRYMVNLNGDVVSSANIDKTFAEAGVYSDCFLTSVTKADSAA